MAVEIIQAEDCDAAAVAHLHTQSWQANYRGILPDEYLETEAVVERLAYWAKALPAGDYSIVLVAWVDGEPAGFIAIKDHLDEGYDVRIEHLHVASEMKGKGLGRLLMDRAAGLLIARGVVSACLWVFEANQAAIGFYESLDGVTDAHGTDKFAGGDAPDRRIGWRDLPALQRACRRGGSR